MIDPLIRVVSVGILLAVVAALAYLIFSYWRTRRTCTSLVGLLEGTPALRPADRQNGLRLEAFNRIEERGGRLGGTARRAWDLLADSFVEYPPGSPRPGMFLARSPEGILAEETVVERLYHGSFHHAVPGLVTGTGLAVTFVAILMALANVSYDALDKVEPVKGIGGLINGLSGKFLSSIVALGCAIVFTLAERMTARSVANQFDRVLQELSKRLPVLTAERILVDIRKEASAQSVSLSNISSDVVDRFVNAFRQDITPGIASGLSEEMVQQLQPTLARMNETLSELKGILARLEQQKQESVTGEIRVLVDGMQKAIQATLGEMGAQFRDSLTGATRHEFGTVESTLQGTAQLLSDMNTRFADLQASLSRIVDKAESTTTGQLEASRDQAQAMTALMQGLMAQLQEASRSSVDAVSARLTLVVDDLSRGVANLSKEMVGAVAELASSSQESAGKVIEQAGTWSEANARRLDELLKSIEARSGEFAQTGRTLMDLQGGLGATIRENQDALKALHAAGAQVVAYTTSLAGQATEIKGFGAQNAKLVVAVSEAVAALRASMETHRGLLQQHDGVLDRYDEAFEGLDRRLEGVLTVILEGLQGYAQTTENNFRSIVGIANEAVPRIAQVLQTQTAELQDNLEELTSVLDKGTRRLEEAVQRGASGPVR